MEIGMVLHAAGMHRYDDAQIVRPYIINGDYRSHPLIAADRL